jgi:hypothetical protein
LIYAVVNGYLAKAAELPSPDMPHDCSATARLNIIPSATSPRNICEPTPDKPFTPAAEPASAIDAAIGTGNCPKVLRHPRRKRREHTAGNLSR